ncbi:hypothetical protein XA68_18199 [Ophiocordyceps unilateralis]|uniref:Uncharacterized protein n=1 Tax=Ophiocordyceps unilateralis TaxID=268505 RepID=A0A2A9P2S3_OPHUN|nr:hypothetical protein XA68_18199 [Ophiocordyceps unilateralis]
MLKEDDATNAKHVEGRALRVSLTNRERHHVTFWLSATTISERVITLWRRSSLSCDDIITRRSTLFYRPGLSAFSQAPFA